MAKRAAPSVRYQTPVTSNAAITAPPPHWRSRHQLRPRPHEPLPRRDQRVVDLVGESGAPSQQHRAHDRDHEEDGCDLEGEEVAGEDRLAELLDVGDLGADGVGAVVGRTDAGGLSVGGGEREEWEREDDEADDECSDALAGDRLDREIFGLVDPQEHEHEQEQHDDGAGVDDHLDGGEEVGLLRHEEHSDPEQGGYEGERRVHWVLADDDTDGAAQADNGRHREDEQLDHQCSSPCSSPFAVSVLVSCVGVVVVLGRWGRLRFGRGG